MDQTLGELIDDCMNLESRIIGLLCFQLGYLNPSTVRRAWGLEISNETKTFLQEEGNKLGGLKKVRKIVEKADENYRLKLSSLAELLDKEDFEIEKFFKTMTKVQFSWLREHVREIKDHLEGNTYGFNKRLVVLDEEGFDIQKQMGGVQFWWLSQRLEKIKHRLEG